MRPYKKFSTEFAGRQLTVEIGKLALQANASCLVRYGDTVVLATAVMAKEPRPGGADFFPLTIEVRENMYAAGKIKGSRFIKREGRPTDTATLCARMIDRGLRPLFNQSIRNEVQVVVTVLSYDNENTFEVISIIASALALHVSDIPWNGPLVGVCVGRVDGKLVINPSGPLDASDMQLIFSVRGETVVMVDAEGKEVKEDDMADAFDFGVREVQPLMAFVEQIRSDVGQPKRDEAELVAMAQPKGEIGLDRKEAVFTAAKEFFAPKLDQYLFNQPSGTKRERKAIAKEALKQFIESLSDDDRHPEILGYINANFEEYLETVVSRAIIETGKRIDGRSVTDIRPLTSEVGTLPRTHGSAIFSRGETQVLSIVTLGAPGDAQWIDEMTNHDIKKGYIHYYNSPPYAFGEAGFFRGAGRREIGHGALAEKALLPVLPNKMTFPYTIMVVSEVMGSNGSSSMASTCGSTLALMDAGVPLTRPVAGIAMGLASDGDRSVILTDLQDFEDGPGGMDFKIAGTAEGITAIQMDTKTLGLSLDICRRTLQQAREARQVLLAHMAETIPAPRAELSQYAPRIVSMQIDPEKIGDVIGTGGKIINAIIDECGVDIDIEDDGMVAITGTNPDGVARAVKWIEDLTKDVKVGEVYNGKVIRLMDFGAFVEILPGRDGMVHISEFSRERVDKITDVAAIGKELTVKVIEIDDKGRINLSVKQADPTYVPTDDERRGRPARRPERPRHDRPRY